MSTRLADEATEPSLTRLIVAASLGNALEFYEILVYGYFAVTVSHAFFPAASPTVSLLATYGSFGVGFLARPVGAIFLGAYGDRKGRRNALTLSITLMTLGTGLMTIMPTYGAIGLAAPVLVVVARLLQGFSVGGEFASSTTFLVEHRPKYAGFLASWQWSSQGFAALIATGFGVALTTSMAPADLDSWGWRIPFGFGLLIGPIGFYIRSRMAETPEFLRANITHTPVHDVVVKQWDRLLLTTGAVIASTSSQYIIVYMPTYAIRQLGLPASVGFAAGVAAAALQTIVVPFVGIWADKIGQSRIMIGSALLFFLTATPVFWLVAGSPSWAVLMAMVCWLGLLKSFYSGALPSLMAAVFPVETRVTGLALSYNIAVAIFGGFAPFFAASLIALTGSNLAPSYYVALAGLLSLVSVLVLRRRFKLR